MSGVVPPGGPGGPKPPGGPGGPPRPPAGPGAPGDGDRGLYGTPRIEKPSAGSIDEMLKKRQALDKERDEQEARTRAEIKRKVIRYGGGGAIATAVVFASLAGWAWYKQSREGCGATDDRRRAVQTIMAQGDAASGTLVGERFPNRKQFRCSELAEPRGILISVKEDSGDPILWFVDQAGTPLNVNLLAASWTPRLGAGPNVGASDIAKVTQD